MIQNKTPKKNRILALIIACVAIAIGIYQVLKDKSDVRKIKNDSQMGIAQVTQLTTNPKSKHLQLVYAFSTGSSTYFEKADYKPLTETKDSLLNRYFPVIYSKEDPAINHLLITDSDFKTFDMEQPDTLKPHNRLIQN